jgi:hypothetical protein
VAIMQIIEFRTSRSDEIEAAFNEFFAATEGQHSDGGHSYLCQDAGEPGRYVNVVIYPSHEDAHRMSSLPETGILAEKLGSAMDGDPTIRVLDVLWDRTE